MKETKKIEKKKEIKIQQPWENLSFFRNQKQIKVLLEQLYNQNL